ncbi:MAG: hypothetical protein C0433_11020 [Cyclobacterium sp.]|nr:hypothetical protein [Cyclobacterium sp.]
MRNCYRILVAKYIFKGSLCFLKVLFCLSLKYKLKNLKFYTDDKITSFLNFLGFTFQLFLIQLSNNYNAFSKRVIDHDYQRLRYLQGKFWQLDFVNKYTQPKTVIFRTFVCVKYILLYIYGIHTCSNS